MSAPSFGSTPRLRGGSAPVNPDSRQRFARLRFAGRVAPLTVALLGASVFGASSPAFAAQAPVGLGTADSFAVLAGSGITNTGPTTITGDVGTFPTTSQTGFGSVTLTGTNHGGDAVTQGAKNDLVTAYDDAAGRNPVTNVAVELGGSTLSPGVYASPTFGLTGTLSLDAHGDPSADFVFQAASTLIAESNSRVVMLNGADPCRVVWQVGSSATFKTATHFIGNVLAYMSITAQTGATFEGRLLARDGAVTLDTNTITKADCAPPTATDAVGSTPATTHASETSSGSPTSSPEVALVAQSETPGVPTPAVGSPGTPSTPSSPRPQTPGDSGPPSLAVTGSAVPELIGMGLGLMGLGGFILLLGRRSTVQLVQQSSPSGT